MFATVVAAFDFSVGVTDEYFHSFASSKNRFIALFDAKVASVVARTVVIVFFEVVLVYFAYVSKHIGCVVVVILAKNAFLNEESGESIKLLLQASVVLCRKMGHERLLRVG